MSSVPERLTGHERDRRSVLPKTHIMLNPVILEIVFKHLDFTRLKIYRAVCKIWNEEICRRLKLHSLSHVRTREDYSTVKKLSTNGEKLKLPRLLQDLSVQAVDQQMLSQILSVPLRITKLHIDDGIDCDSEKTSWKLHTILLNCCSTLTSLNIPFCHIAAHKTTPEGLELKFPLLRELGLTIKETSNELGDLYELNLGADLVVGRNQPAEVTEKYSFFSKLVASAPKLSELQIIYCSGPLVPLLETLTLEKITSLKIWTSHVCDPVNQMLKNVRVINLKRFSLTRVLFDEEDEDFRENRYLLGNMKVVIQRNAESLESLTLMTKPLMSTLCPNLKELRVWKFTDGCWDLSCFPSLSTISIHKLDSSLSSSLHICPASVETVKIDYMGYRNVRESLRKVYQFFCHTASSWELPDRYVEDFCDFISARNVGFGVRKLAITFRHYRTSLNFGCIDLAQELLKTQNFHDLEELTLKNRHQGFYEETWDSFDPQLMPKLRTLSFFSHIGSTELPDELLRKLKHVKNVVLLHSGARNPRDEELLFALPNASLQHGEIDFYDWQDNYDPMEGYTPPDLSNESSPEDDSDEPELGPEYFFDM